MKIMTYHSHGDGGFADFEPWVLHVGNLFVHVVNNFEVLGFFRLRQGLKVRWLRLLFRKQIFGRFSSLKRLAWVWAHRLVLGVIHGVSRLLARDFDALRRAGSLSASTLAHSTVDGGSLRLLKHVGHLL